jgi:hypothetical protein
MELQRRQKGFMGRLYFLQVIRNRLDGFRESILNR